MGRPLTDRIKGYSINLIVNFHKVRELHKVKFEKEWSKQSNKVETFSPIRF